MVYAPIYTTEADVRLVSDLATTTISSDDMKNLIKRGENKIKSLIKKDDIDDSDWSPVPDLVLDAATNYSIAECLRKIYTKHAGVEGGVILSVINSYIKEGDIAWQNYLDSTDVSKGKKVVHRIMPRVGEFDEEGFREIPE